MAHGCVIRHGAGISFDYTPLGAITGGDVVVVGNLVLVAQLDIAASKKGNAAFLLVARMPKANVALTAGQIVYWDEDGNPVGGVAGTGAITDVETGNKQAGFVIPNGEKDAADTTVDVFLFPAGKDLT